MDSRKRLYVVSSWHHTSNGIVNKEVGVMDIAEVRIRTIVAIARTTRFGCYFSDGLNLYLTQKLNEALDTWPFDKISRVAGCAYADGHDGYRFWEFMALGYWFKRAAKEGITSYRFKQTETDEKTKQRQRRKLRRQIIGNDRKDFGANFDSNEQMEMVVDYAEMVLRDKNFVKKIEGNGGEENILYVGSDHQLETLQDSFLEWYRLEVAYDKRSKGKVIAVTGEIPERFKNNLEVLVASDSTSSGKTVDLDVSFI